MESQNKLQNPNNLIRTHKYWRFLEVIPGLLTWIAFLWVIFGSVFFPVITANLLITYTLVWVFRTFLFSFNLSKSYHYSLRAQKTDWNKLLSFIESPSKLSYLIEKVDYSFDPLILRLKKGPLEPKLLDQINLLKANNEYLKPSEIYHCITLFNCQETYQVIKTSVDSYAKSNFDLKKIIFIFAYEEFDKENALEINRKIKQEYGHMFGKYIESCHPQNLPNEIKGRAGNMNWAGKILKSYLEEKNIQFSKVILSSFDADTVISQDFISELTFRYCITPNRVEVGYQPVPFYHNNIWDVPVFNRLVAISCSFWQLSVSLRKDENKSFSSRSMSFQSVIDFGYWDARVVQDDSRQFWTAYFVYGGRHYLENIYSPVYMDAVLSDSYIKTIKSQYKQLRRWAWGVSDFPFIVFNILKTPKIPFLKKIYEILHFLESVFFWATGPIILLLSGSIPSSLNPEFRDNILSYNLPVMMSQLMNIASVGIIVCILITTQIIPFDRQKSTLKKVGLFLQWFLVPIVSVCLSSIPAIDAQTRLMINKRLDFQVTEKSRKKSTDSEEASV